MQYAWLTCVSPLAPPIAALCTLSGTPAAEKSGASNRSSCGEGGGHAARERATRRGADGHAARSVRARTHCGTRLGREGVSEAVVVAREHRVADGADGERAAPQDGARYPLGEGVDCRRAPQHEGLSENMHADMVASVVLHEQRFEPSRLRPSRGHARRDVSRRVLAHHAAARTQKQRVRRARPATHASASSQHRYVARCRNPTKTYKDLRFAPKTLWLDAIVDRGRGSRDRADRSPYVENHRCTDGARVIVPAGARQRPVARDGAGACSEVYGRLAPPLLTARQAHVLRHS